MVNLNFLITEKSKALIEKAIAYYDENKDLPGDISVETVATTEIVPVGNYTSVAESYNFFCYHNNGDDFETKDSLNLRYHCFKAGSDEELLFVEIFKDGVDFREALKKALLRCFEKNIIDGEKLGSDQPSLEAFVEAAVHDINGFALYRNYMLLSYTKLSDIILRFLEVPEKDFDEYESMMRLVHYDFFDEGVLDIFE